jgi:hypothetical protein
MSTEKFPHGMRTVTEEEWKAYMDRLDAGAMEPCDHWSIEQCFCKGACGCHWKAEKDVRVEYFRHADQGVNELPRCARVTHIPTGIYVDSKEDVMRHENAALAMKKLDERIADLRGDEKTCGCHGSWDFTFCGDGKDTDIIQTCAVVTRRIVDRYDAETIEMNVGSYETILGEQEDEG